jgi:hypothetical protein
VSISPVFFFLFLVGAGGGRRRSIIDEYKKEVIDHVHKIGLVGRDGPVHREYIRSVRVVVRKKKSNNLW